MDVVANDSAAATETDALIEEKHRLEMELRTIKRELIQRDRTITALENNFSVKMNMFRSLAIENEKHQIFLTHLMKNSVDFLILVDSHLNIAYCSDSFLHKIGAKYFENIENRSILDIYALFADNELFKLLANALAIAVGQDETSRHDIVVDIEGRGDGRVYRVTNTPMTDKNVNGVVINWNDVTDITDAKNKAEEASKAKGDFLSNMSHEIRTPLSAIIGMTSIGKKGSDIEQKNYALSKIEDASSHLLGIINDVLDMAKIEANKLELSHVEYDFERMLQKVMTVINYRVDEKRQKLTVSTKENIPNIVVGDDQRLAQVLTNLLSNAVKFTPESGSIWLDVSLLNETDGVCELGIEISDTGIGISRQQQEKLFMAFEQAESGISRVYGGTGLGLVISQRIVELMGGKIEVESEFGKGAKFIFSVKVLRGKKETDIICECPQEDIVDEKQTSPAGEFCGKRLLLAEDIEINREIFITLLEDTGVVIDCAEHGIEALNMVQAAHEGYDMVIMDVQMPHMDGLEAARRIRALPAHRREELPIIALTANVFKDDIEACYAAGMDDHLGKPLDIELVLEKLRKYMQRQP